MTNIPIKGEHSPGISVATTGDGDEMIECIRCFRIIEMRDGEETLITEDGLQACEAPYTAEEQNSLESFGIEL